MSQDEDILIIKFGALGDVVRTSYFAQALKAARPGCRIHWITQRACVPLLAHNPHIDEIHIDPAKLAGRRFATIYSLDDEKEAVVLASSLACDRMVGAHLSESGLATYTDSVATWFDMGLNSKFGKVAADSLKVQNSLTHANIFASIFETAVPTPNFYNEPGRENAALAQCQKLRHGHDLLVGINAFAGARWPSKSLPSHEYRMLLDMLTPAQCGGLQAKVLLLGAGEDAVRNTTLHKELGSPAHITPMDTSHDVLDLAGIIKGLDLLVTSDSLALHLAIGQQIPVVTFFASTSAAEIENGASISKVISTAPDYCSYKPNADNTTITARRVMAAASALMAWDR